MRLRSDWLDTRVDLSFSYLVQRLCCCSILIIHTDNLGRAASADLDQTVPRGAV